MIEHSSPPNAQPPFPYNFGQSQSPRRPSSIPRTDTTFENMEEITFEEGYAMFDDFYGPSILSSSPAAPNDTTAGLKRNSDANAMLLDAPTSPVEILSATGSKQGDALGGSSELAELHDNPWVVESRESAAASEPVVGLPSAMEVDTFEQPPPTHTSHRPDISFLIHTTPPLADEGQANTITDEEVSGSAQAPPDLSPILAPAHDVPDAILPEASLEENASPAIVDGQLLGEPQVQESRKSASPSPPSEPTTEDELRPLAAVKEVQETVDTHMPTAMELSAMNEQNAIPDFEDEVRGTPNVPTPVIPQQFDPDKQATLPDSHNVDHPSSIPQLPTYVPSSMILQAVSGLLPQQTTPVPPSSSHKSELQAEMRAEEDAASSPIRPAPVSAFSDRLKDTPGQHIDASPSSDYSLDKYGNIVFEEEESEGEADTQRPNPKKISPDDSAVEVAKVPRPKRVQPGKLRVNPDRPHWAQLKKPVPQRLPPRIKQVPVQRTSPSVSPSASPPASGFRFPPQMQQRNVSTRSSTANKPAPRPTSNIKLEDAESSLTDLSSRSPSPPRGGFRMPSEHNAAPPPQQYSRAPSARLQLQQKPKPQPPKKRKPHRNLLESMVPPEFNNTGGSFVTRAEQESEIVIEGDTQPNGTRKRTLEDDEIAYDEEGRRITRRRPAPAPAPAPKRAKTKAETKPRAQPKPKAPINKELMSIVGASVLADMQPNSPRKTRNQQRQLDATAPNASAAAKRRHTKQGKLIAG